MKNILIVDDHPMVRSAFVFFIKMIKPDCLVIDVGSYELARNILHERGGLFDLILLDLDLHGDRDGLILLSQYREAKMLGRVVIHANFDDPSVVLRCIRSGASGFLVKAFSNEAEFSGALAAILDRRVCLPSSVLGGCDSRCPEESLLPEEPFPSPLRDVLYLLCQGCSDELIAQKMGVPPSSIRRRFVSPLLRRYGISRRMQLLVELARRKTRVLASWEEIVN